MDLKNAIYQRFVRYAKVDTQSDDKSRTFPSTKKQLVLLKMLAAELKAIGAKKVKMDKYGYVTAEVPATVKGRKPVIGLLAHVDTATSAEHCGTCDYALTYALLELLTGTRGIHSLINDFY